MSKMKKNLNWMVMSAAVLGMGMAMPSCPGQQEMQQKIDSLQTTNTDLSKKIQALTTQVNALNSDMSQVKTLLPQMTNIITGLQTSNTKLTADLDALQKAQTVKASFKKKGR